MYLPAWYLPLVPAWSVGTHDYMPRVCPHHPPRPHQEQQCAHINHTATQPTQTVPHCALPSCLLIRKQRSRLGPCQKPLGFKPLSTNKVAPEPLEACQHPLRVIVSSHPTPAGTRCSNNTTHKALCTAIGSSGSTGQCSRHYCWQQRQHRFAARTALGSTGMQ